VEQSNSGCADWERAAKTGGFAGGVVTLMLDCDEEGQNGVQ
jgi:hypothetical protein